MGEFECCRRAGVPGRASHYSSWAVQTDRDVGLHRAARDGRLVFHWRIRRPVWGNAGLRQGPGQTWHEPRADLETWSDCHPTVSRVGRGLCSDPGGRACPKRSRSADKSHRKASAACAAGDQGLSFRVACPWALSISAWGEGVVALKTPAHTALKLLFAAREAAFPDSRRSTGGHLSARMRVGML